MSYVFTIFVVINSQKLAGHECVGELFTLIVLQLEQLTAFAVRHATNQNTSLCGKSSS